MFRIASFVATRFCEKSNAALVRRGSCVAIAAVLVCATAARQADADIAVAGSLVADMRPSALAGPDNTTWVNGVAGVNSVGDFRRADMGALTVTQINGTYKGNPISTPALAIEDVDTNQLISASMVPASLTGNATRSVEAWLQTYDAAATQGVLSWGIRGQNQQMSRFSYHTGNANGMVSGWFADSTWGSAILTGDIAHVVWTYDGTTSRGYINGVLHTTSALTPNAALNTPASLMYIGAAPAGGTDALHGYIAELRVHTGVLNQTQITNNFDEGIDAIDGLACDFNGDDDCDSGDFTTLTNNLFTSGGRNAGDYNLDGLIDLKDLRQFKDDPERIIGMGGAGAGSFAAVPEPTSLVFAVFACIAAVSTTRRRVA